jgi:UDP-GlcNAc3NAcA epimerase
MLPQKLEKALFDRVNSNSEILIIPPASFLDMIVLEKNTSMVITDSGGVQKEAYFFEKPCIILRSETEWKEIVEVGAAIIANADEERIISAWKSFQNNDNLKFTPVFGNGEAAEFICEAMIVNAALLD